MEAVHQEVKRLSDGGKGCGCLYTTTAFQMSALTSNTLLLPTLKQLLINPR